MMMMVLMMIVDALGREVGGARLFEWSDATDPTAPISEDSPHACIHELMHGWLPASLMDGGLWPEHWAGGTFLK
jgi:hypothetical protein